VDNFKKEVIVLVVEFFSHGVRVNGVHYTIDMDGYMSNYGANHVATEYRYWIMFRFVGQVLLNVPQSLFCDDEQVKMIEEMNVFMSTSLQIQDMTMIGKDDDEIEMFDTMIEDKFKTKISVVHGSTDAMENIEDSTLHKLSIEDNLENENIVAAHSLSVGFSHMGGFPGRYINQYVRANEIYRINKRVKEERDNAIKIYLTVSVKYRVYDHIYFATNTILLTGRWDVKKMGRTYFKNMIISRETFYRHQEKYALISFFWATVRIKYAMRYRIL